MENSNNTLIFSIFLALLIAFIGFSSVGLLPYFFPTLSPYVISIITLIGVPLISYFISVAFSIMKQYNMCKKINAKSAFISQFFLAFIVFLVCFVLFLESLPIYKYIFGPYPPINPLTGEIMQNIVSENHYKIQFFSGIVKAVLPLGINESMKDGFVHMYWLFFSSLLSSFFLMKIQTC